MARLFLLISILSVTTRPIFGNSSKTTEPEPKLELKVGCRLEAGSLRIACPGPTDTPTDMSTDTPTDMPTDTPTDTPTDMPTDTPTDTPTDISTDTPTDMPTDTPSSVCECFDPTLGTNDNHCDYPHGFRHCGVYPNSTCDDLLCSDFANCTSVFACPSEPQPSEYPKCDTDPACQCMNTKQCEGDSQCNLCNEAKPFQVCRIDPNSQCQDKFCKRVKGEPNRCFSIAACGCSTFKG